MLDHFYWNDLQVMAVGLFLRDTAPARNTLHSSLVFMDDHRVEQPFTGCIKIFEKPGRNPTLKWVASSLLFPALQTKLK